jgi:hypothetical protein
MVVPGFSRGFRPVGTRLVPGATAALTYIMVNSCPKERQKSSPSV